MIDRRPISNKPTAPNLDQRVAAALGGNGGTVSSDDLERLVGEINDGIAEAANRVEDLRSQSLNPITSASDAEAASQAASLADLHRDRLAAALPRIEQRLREVLQGEYAERWLEDYQRTEAACDKLAAELRETYPAAVAKLIELYQRMEACDRESDRVNSQAPDGEDRRLHGVELTARDLEAFSRSQPSILKSMVLPEWENSEHNAWPPQQPPMAAHFAASPFDPRINQGRWHEVLAERDQQQREDAVRTNIANAERAQGHEALADAERRAMQRGGI